MLTLNVYEKEQSLATHCTAKVSVNSLIISSQLGENKEQTATTLQQRPFDSGTVQQQACFLLTILMSTKNCNSPSPHPSPLLLLRST